MVDIPATAPAPPVNAGWVPRAEARVTALSLQLGPVHPITVAQRHRFVERLVAAGEDTIAMDSLRRLVDDMHRWLGPSDPATVVAHAELADRLTEMGDIESAKIERLLIDAATRTRAARHRYGDGRLDEALEMLSVVEQSLMDCQTQACTHARLRCVRLQLEWLLEADRSAEAAPVSVRLQELVSSLQGPQTV